MDADWKLGVAAVGLDRIDHVVKLANGEDVEYDRLLIATGTRARPWPKPEEGALQGVFTVRTVEDAAALSAALTARPKRVLIVGPASSARRSPRCARPRPARDGGRTGQGPADGRAGRGDQ